MSRYEEMVLDEEAVKDGEMVQMSVRVPRGLKRRFFVALMARDQSYTAWTVERVEGWLKGVEGGDSSKR